MKCKRHKWTTNSSVFHFELGHFTTHSIKMNTNVSVDDLENNRNVSRNDSFLEDLCASDGVPLVPEQVPTVIHVLTLLVAMLGNILLITAILRMKDNMMLLIVNMAASDLLVAIFLIPRLITREVIRSNAFLVHGSGGAFLCKMCTFLSDMSLAVSTQSLVIIFVERLSAIVYPMLYKRITLSVRRGAIFSTWILSAAIHSPYFYTMRLISPHSNDKRIQLCMPTWEPAFDHEPAHLRYNIILFTTVLLIPLLVISVLSAIVVYSSRKDELAASRTERCARRNRERIRKLHRMAAVTVTALFICWTPFVVFSFLDLFSLSPVSECIKIQNVMRHISRILASSYCAVNPCICLIFLRNFSRELTKICKSNFC